MRRKSLYYYCQNHSVPCRRVCICTGHRKCDSIEPVEESAEGLWSKEYDKIFVAKGELEKRNYRHQIWTREKHFGHWRDLGQFVLRCRSVVYRNLESYRKTKKMSISKSSLTNARSAEKNCEKIPNPLLTNLLIWNNVKNRSTIWKRREMTLSTFANFMESAKNIQP